MKLEKLKFHTDMRFVHITGAYENRDIYLRTGPHRDTSVVEKFTNVLKWDMTQSLWVSLAQESGHFTRVLYLRDCLKSRIAFELGFASTSTITLLNCSCVKTVNKFIAELPDSQDELRQILKKTFCLTREGNELEEGQSRYSHMDYDRQMVELMIAYLKKTHPEIQGLYYAKNGYEEVCIFNPSNTLRVNTITAWRKFDKNMFYPEKDILWMMIDGMEVIQGLSTILNSEIVHSWSSIQDIVNYVESRYGYNYNIETLFTLCIAFIHTPRHNDQISSVPNAFIDHLFNDDELYLLLFDIMIKQLNNSQFWENSIHPSSTIYRIISMLNQTQLSSLCCQMLHQKYFAWLMIHPNIMDKLSSDQFAKLCKIHFNENATFTNDCTGEVCRLTFCAKLIKLFPVQFCRIFNNVAENVMNSDEKISDCILHANPHCSATQLKRLYSNLNPTILQLMDRKINKINKKLEEAERLQSTTKWLQQLMIQERENVSRIRYERYLHYMSLQLLYLTQLLTSHSLFGRLFRGSGSLYSFTLLGYGCLCFTPEVLATR